MDWLEKEVKDEDWMDECLYFLELILLFYINSGLFLYLFELIVLKGIVLFLILIIFLYFWECIILIKSIGYICKIFYKMILFLIKNDESFEDNLFYVFIF